MDEVSIDQYPHQKELIQIPGGARWRHIIWLRSSQPKPTVGVAYPDLIIETDTCNTYYFNDETRQWDLQ